MNGWIDFAALGKILLGGLICGAGLPAVFALGLRALHMGAPGARRRPEHTGGTTTATVDTGPDRLVGGSPLGIAIAVVCFAIVLAAIGWGIYLIVASS